MGVMPSHLTLRVGCRVSYRTTDHTPILAVIRPRLEGPQVMRAERVIYGPDLPCEEFEDDQGNITARLILQPGDCTIQHDALIDISPYPDTHESGVNAVPVAQIPPRLLRYTLPSRYCDSDKLLDFAWIQFGQVPNGRERVQAICDWVHQNIEYRFGSGRPDISAAEVITQRYGVCRDFAHVGIALCRAFNLPARYVSGHLPDIGFRDPGTPMDFHAYFEVFLDGKWSVFDARFNKPRVGRVKVAHGLDAVDGAFITIYGQGQMTWFEVWAYQVDPTQVSVGDPIDLSKRLDGVPEIRYF